MDFALSPSELTFKDEVRTWLEEHLVGEFAALKGRGGTGQEDIEPAVLIEWERELAKGNWLGLGYPAELGGREVTLFELPAIYSQFHANLDQYLATEQRPGAHKTQVIAFEQPGLVRRQSERVARPVQRIDSGEQHRVEHDPRVVRGKARRVIAIDRVAPT